MCARRAPRWTARCRRRSSPPGSTPRSTRAWCTSVGPPPAGSGFVDFAPLHLITTSTLDRIAELSPRGTIELERYRPNLVIRTEEPGFVENGWLGREIRIGKRLRLLVIARTPRCAVPTLEHGKLPRDVAALRTLAEHNRIRPMPDAPKEPCAGVYAQVLAPGGIVAGDRVLLAD